MVVDTDGLVAVIDPEIGIAAWLVAITTGNEAAEPCEPSVNTDPPTAVRLTFGVPEITVVRFPWFVAITTGMEAAEAADPRARDAPPT